MDIYVQMASNIIKAQQSIVGPVAFEQAKKVDGLKIGTSADEVKIEGNKKDVLERLIKQYEGILGMASVEVCRDAVRGIIDTVPREQLPKPLVS